MQGFVGHADNGLTERRRSRNPENGRVHHTGVLPKAQTLAGVMTGMRSGIGSREAFGVRRIPALSRIA
jgi:hypothetical protein